MKKSIFVLSIGMNINAPLHLCKFSDLYENYGVGVAKNIWLLTGLLPLARTVNLYKMKAFVGGVVEKEGTKTESYYKRLRLIWFFQDWSANEALFRDLMQHNLRIHRGWGFKTLVMDVTSWTIEEAKVHYLVLIVQVGSMALPNYQVHLEKIGTSRQEQRKAMFKEAFCRYNLERMTLLAPQEYICQDWLKFLKDRNIYFGIRLRIAIILTKQHAAPEKGYERMLLKSGGKTN